MGHDWEDSDSPRNALSRGGGGAPKPPFSPPTPPSSTQMYKHNHQNGPSTAPRGGPLAGNTPREGSPRGDFVPAVVILLKVCIFVRGGR